MTLIEVLVALALFAIIAIAFAGGLGTASKAVLTADIRTNAESLARTQMEYVKTEDYEEAPDGGVYNYTKIPDTDIREGYTIWSVNRDGDPDNGNHDDPIIAIPWDSGNNTAEDIDTAVKLGLGHPMGPFALADLTGMDTNLFVANTMYEELKDPSYVPPVLLKKMVTAGWLGRKTGKGFYEYK